MPTFSRPQTLQYAIELPPKALVDPRSGCWRLWEGQGGVSDYPRVQEPPRVNVTLLFFSLCISKNKIVKFFLFIYFKKYFFLFIKKSHLFLYLKTK